MSESGDGLEILGVLDHAKDATGKEFVLSPLGLSDYATIRNKSLDWYRRDILKTYSENADLYPGDPTVMIKAKFEEMAKFRVDNLPVMEVTEYEDDANSWATPVEDRVVKKVHKVDYMSWWMSSNPEGMMFVLWMSARKDPGQSHMTSQDVEEMFMRDGQVDIETLERAAQKLGQLSQPSLAGNGEVPSAGDKKKRRAEREKRRKRREKRGTGH